jgi:hypothetical protein
MPWVTDSRTAGYLGPTSAPPLDDDAFYDFLHDLIAGITGMAGNMIRPAWVEEPANQPPLPDNWCAFAVNSEEFDWMPAVIHLPDGEGQDRLSRHIESTITVTFFGPKGAANAGLLRDGLFVAQNTAMLRAASMGVIEINQFTLSPELFRNNRWYNRVDIVLRIRREQVRFYPVRNIVQAEGTVTANTFTDHTVDREFETDVVPG